ncbi:MAG: D-2-hydroxyacid dehydrogenase [Anaerolineales bacterium]|nr:D-2-hydroxyacid dehydrogenase [Anaerolineales bacterium]
MNSQILIHGAIDPAALAQLQKNVTGRFTILEADMEEKDWSAPAAVAGDIQLMLSTHPPQNLAEMKSLAFWQIGSVGFTQIVGLGLSERGVHVSNARGVFDVPIGEWNIAMMINLARDLRGLIRNQEAGVWDPAARYQQGIYGATVGLWGYGGIGRETARLARALGMRVHVLSRSGVGPRDNVFVVAGTGDPAGLLPDKVYAPEQWREFLAELDFLILAMPLSPSTRGLIGPAQLAALPPHAFLLNPARGPIVQEDALLAALDNGQIAGAALDTHFYYPMPPDHPLWRYPNVIMTPHISGSSKNRDFVSRIWSIFNQNIDRLSAGQPLLNELTAAELAGNS